MTKKPKKQEPLSPCCRADVLAVRNRSETWKVALIDHGVPIEDFLDETDQADLVGYECNECDRPLGLKDDRFVEKSTGRFTYDEHDGPEGKDYPITEWEEPGVLEKDVVCILTDTTAEFAAKVVALLNKEDA